MKTVVEKYLSLENIYFFILLFDELFLNRPTRGTNQSNSSNSFTISI